VPSSPTLPAETNTTHHERLLAVLQRVPDPRDRRGVRYSLAGVLALAVTATVAGCRSFAAIGQWAGETAADKLTCFGLTSGSVPDESTLRKLFARLDADALDRALGTWMWTRTFTVEQAPPPMAARSGSTTSQPPHGSACRHRVSLMHNSFQR